MKNIKKGIIGISVGMGLSALATSGALAADAHMVTGSIAAQPIGHAEFCRSFPAECKVRSARTKAPHLSRKRWGELVAINNSVNEAVTPVTDRQHYDREEFWTFPGQFGDCEDYVLLKRHLLMKAGWPASSLLITVVRQSNGDGHAVLTVRTDRADYILDNLDPMIREWRDTPYRYVSRQSERHSGRWAKVRDRRRSARLF